MLHVTNLEEIQNLLLQVSGLIDALDRHDPEFFRLTKEWLSQTERVLLNNRVAVAADVAVLRGTLISAERGIFPPGFEFGNRTSVSKIRNAYAAEVLRKAEESVSATIKGDVARFAEGERLTQQIMAVAHRKGLIRATSGAGARAERIHAIWQVLSADHDLAAATTHLMGLIGTPDTLILIDRLLPNLDDI